MTDVDVGELRDPHAGWLQRVQIVKGWVEDGKAQERVFDVAEMMEWVKTGEAALSGTAAVLAGVGTLVRSDGTEVKVGGTGDVVIDGGIDGRVARLMWFRGPMWGYVVAAWGGFALWLALFPLTMTGVMPLWLAFPISCFLATAGYVTISFTPSTASVRNHTSMKGPKMAPIPAVP